MAQDAQERAARAYNAAADCYDSGPLGFWDYFGRRTVDRLGLTEGTRILDVCCGSGASAIPAAKAVGPTGEVIGVDLAESLLQLARRKAANLGLRNTQFEVGDLLALRFAPNTFDAVVCVFGIFFLPDMAAAARELWLRVKPGGKLVVTTWAKGFCEPANEIFWRAVADVRPDLYKGFNPWDRIDNEIDLAWMLTDAGIENVQTEIEHRLHPLNSADDWWTIVLGSGYRGTIEQLTEGECAKVRSTTLKRVGEANIRAVHTDAIYALSGK